MLADHDLHRINFFQKLQPKNIDSNPLEATLNLGKGGTGMISNLEEVNVNDENEGDTCNKPNSSYRALITVKRVENDTIRQPQLVEHMKHNDQWLEQSIERAKRLVMKDLSSPRFPKQLQDLQTSPLASLQPQKLIKEQHSRNYSSYTHLTPQTKAKGQQGEKLGRNGGSSLLISHHSRQKSFTSLSTPQSRERNDNLFMLQEFVQKVKKDLIISSSGEKRQQNYLLANFNTTTTAVGTFSSSRRHKSQHLTSNFSKQCETCLCTSQQPKTTRNIRRSNDDSKQWEQTLRKQKKTIQEKPPKIPRNNDKSKTPEHARYESNLIQKKIEGINLQNEDKQHVDGLSDQRKKVLRKFLNPGPPHNPQKKQRNRITTVIFDCSQHRFSL